MKAMITQIGTDVEEQFDLALPSPFDEYPYGETLVSFAFNIKDTSVQIDLVGTNHYVKEDVPVEKPEDVYAIAKRLVLEGCLGMFDDPAAAEKLTACGECKWCGGDSTVGDLCWGKPAWNHMTAETARGDHRGSKGKLCSRVNTDGHCQYFEPK